MSTQNPTLTDTAPATDQIASVLLVIQGSLALVASLSTIPFSIVEPWLRLEAALTLALAGWTFFLARVVRLGRRRARRCALVLQVLYVAGTLLVGLLPIDALRGPVPVLTNLALPMAIFALVAARSTRGQ